MRLDEPLLGSVLGLGGASGHEIRSPERDPLICAHEFLIGVFVAPLCPFDELFFCGWSAHHRRSYTGSARKVPRQRGGSEIPRSVFASSG